MKTEILCYMVFGGVHRIHITIDYCTRFWCGIAPIRCYSNMNNTTEMDSISPLSFRQIFVKLNEKDLSKQYKTTCQSQVSNEMFYESACPIHVHSLQNTFYFTVLDSNIFRKKNGVTYISFSFAELYLIIASYKLNDTASWPSHLYYENSYAGVSLLNQLLVVKSFPVVMIYNVIPKISLPLKMSSQIRMFWYWRNIIKINIGCCQFSFWKIRSQKKKKRKHI